MKSSISFTGCRGVGVSGCRDDLASKGLEVGGKMEVKRITLPGDLAGVKKDDFVKIAVCDTGRSFGSARRGLGLCDDGYDCGIVWGVDGDSEFNRVWYNRCDIALINGSSPEEPVHMVDYTFKSEFYGLGQFRYHFVPFFMAVGHPLHERFWEQFGKLKLLAETA